MPMSAVWPRRYQRNGTHIRFLGVLQQPACEPTASIYNRDLPPFISSLSFFDSRISTLNAAIYPSGPIQLSRAQVPSKMHRTARQTFAPSSEFEGTLGCTRPTRTLRPSSSRLQPPQRNSAVWDESMLWNAASEVARCEKLDEIPRSIAGQHVYGLSSINTPILRVHNYQILCMPLVGSSELSSESCLGLGDGPVPSGKVGSRASTPYAIAIGHCQSPTFAQVLPPSFFLLPKPASRPPPQP